MEGARALMPSTPMSFMPSSRRVRLRSDPSASASSAEPRSPRSLLYMSRSTKPVRVASEGDRETMPLPPSSLWLRTRLLREASALRDGARAATLRALRYPQRLHQDRLRLCSDLSTL